MPEIVIFRYLVGDVPAAIAFYTQYLGFTLDSKDPQVLAAVTRGVLRLVLTGPDATGAKPVLDGSRQGPGGWARIQVVSPDLSADVARLTAAGARFRTGIESGVASYQILMSDPFGNVIELVQFKQELERMAGVAGFARQAIVRYLVDDVAAAVAFYSTQLGFAIGINNPPVLAEVTRGALRLVLSGPTATGAKPVLDGGRQSPGGWNRIQLAVPDLTTEVARLRGAGARFRSDILSGVSALQILMNDPSSNTIELVQFTKK